MKKRVFILALILGMLLGGCSWSARIPHIRLPEIDLPEIHWPQLPFELPWRRDEAAAGGTVSVCRLVAPDADTGERTSATGALTGWESCPLPEGADPVETAIGLFAGPSGERGLVCALPEGVQVESWSLEDGAVTLELSEGYLSLPGMERTAAAFCAALTLCRLDGVDRVDIAAGGETVFSGLTPDDALLQAAVPASPVPQQTREPTI